MRQLIGAAILGLVLSTSTGCLLPIFDGEPVRRTRQLLFVSENFRTILDEWERVWLLDMPNHMTPYRVHGGLL